ncbi:hypothetical protein SAMN02745673_03184 [Marinactinospora thermotolerans DSM 45154]|uniref:Uncharacterized protein n=1 Tax=Marinactinospora thermotolerans DSM 45154 TaxID=1122192 RepID=A0A1T4S5J5_9ACTN|nr:hypothetical protein [Marinactinospora thermotolerans]SKA23168.1 hypothetical protein SAMN02745673_03184 [Marinactinospora thermotolerans DSM 45154]
MSTPTQADDSGARPHAIAPLLQYRVEAGIGRALNRHRPGDSEETDIAVLSAPELLQEYGIIPSLLRPPVGTKVSARDVDAAITAIGDMLCEHPSRLLAAVYRPLSIVPALRQAQQTPEAHLSLNHQWFAWCWTSEAAWRALHSLPGGDPSPLTATEVEILTPVAARHRFLALSEPYRDDRGVPGPVPSDAAHALFGTRSHNVLLAHSRHARWEWSKLLSRHESLAALDGAEPGEIEAETDLLLFEFPVKARNARRGPMPSVRPGPPLAIGPARRTSRGSRYTIEDVDFASGVIERHLLPRYQIFTVARAALALAERPRLGRFTAVMTLCLAGLALAGVLISPWSSSFPFTDRSALGFSAVLAGAAYVTGLVGLLVHGRSWGLPWLLRIPAASAIGLLMLTTMHPSWWGAAFEPTDMQIPGREPGPEPPLAPMEVALLLAVAAFAYLLANARNTAVGVAPALLRAFTVWCAASAHALLIALLGLAWIVPAFSENGHLFRGAWTLYPEAALAALLQAGAWCLVAGVFSQILWDDRPLTAPLAHAHWRTQER